MQPWTGCAIGVKAVGVRKLGDEICVIRRTRQQAIVAIF
jgi:hypothetical protein